MPEENEAATTAQPVDSKKSTRNKIAVGIFLLATTVGAMSFIYFAAKLVKKPLGTSRETEETTEVQDDARYHPMPGEREFTEQPGRWPGNSLI